MPTKHESRRAFLGTAAGAAVAAALPGRPAPAAEPPGDPQITAVTLIHGIPGKEEDLKLHLLSLAGPTRAEPGCITYRSWSSSGCPSRRGGTR